MIKGVKIGIDARMLSYEKSAIINAKIKSLDCKMIYPPQNLVDIIWKNKPMKSDAPVFKQEIEYIGNFLATCGTFLFKFQTLFQDRAHVRNLRKLEIGSEIFSRLMRKVHLRRPKST
jgi:hypothetical protein